MRHTNTPRICRIALIAAGLVVPAAAPLQAQQQPPARGQFAIDASSRYALALSFAAGPRNLPLFVGLRAGYAYELTSHSYDGSVFDVIHGEAFARYQPTEWIQGELGMTFLASSPEEESRERRSLFGAYASVMVGYRFMFMGPQIRIGSMGSEFGTIRAVAVRWVIPFGGG